MDINQYTKESQKLYCKTVLAEHGQLTKEIFDKINAGDEGVMRRVYIAQQQRIQQIADQIEDLVEREIVLTQIDSIQEVLDVLPIILKS